MPEVVDVKIQVDATSAVIGSQQASSAITGAMDKISGSTNQLSEKSKTATQVMERFTSAPTRGISVLYALDASLVQATGGMQALGAAAPFAASGIRGALFALESFGGPLLAITIGLTALAAVFAVVKSKASETVDQLLAMLKPLQELSKEAGLVGTAAARQFAKDWDDANKKVADLKVVFMQNDTQLKQSQKVMADLRAEFAKPLRDPSDIKSDILFEQHRNKALAATNKTLLDRIAIGTKAINDFEKPYAEELLKGIAVEAARSSGMEKHGKALQDLAHARLAVELDRIKNTIEGYSKENDAIVKNISLQSNLLGDQARSAKTIGEINILVDRQIKLIQQETALRIADAATELERRNAAIQGNISLTNAEANRLSFVKSISDANIRKNRELEQSYQRIGAAIENSLNAALFRSGSLLQRMHGLLLSILEDLAKMAIHKAASSIFGKIFGGVVGAIVGGPAGAIVGAGIGGEVSNATGSVGRVSAQSDSSTPVSRIAIPTVERAINFTINLHALDTETLVRAVHSKIIPILENAANNRLTRLAVN